MAHLHINIELQYGITAEIYVTQFTRYKGVLWRYNYIYNRIGKWIGTFEVGNTGKINKF